MSLWEVDDVATMKLMTYFANQLRTDPPSEAMRKAMLELRKTDGNPAHWPLSTFSETGGIHGSHLCQTYANDLRDGSKSWCWLDFALCFGFWCTQHELAVQGQCFEEHVEAISLMMRIGRGL
jgi:hypothetical protein